MKLIDADTLIIQVQELIKEYERRMPEYSVNDMLTSGKDAAMKWGYKADGVEDVLKLIIDAPIIKAESIKHGRWVCVETVRRPIAHQICLTSVQTMKRLISARIVGREWW